MTRFRALLVCLLTLGLPGPSFTAEEPAPVRVARPEPAETAETLRLTGTVTAERRAGLSPRLSGLVATVHVDAGDRVKEGQVLLELDRTLAELALRRATASLEEARARLAEARRLREEALQLVKDRHLPETEGHAREANVKINAATVARLEAEVREQAERLERHSVVAPFAGVISRKGTEAGEWVETGTPVLDLVGTERLRLDVQVPQERFGQIDLETRVTVRLDAYPDETFPGWVVAAVPVHDPAARTFLARIVLEHPDGRMIPGMSAQALFRLRGESRALLVPRDAVVRTADGNHQLWVVDRVDGTVRAFPREVRLGRSLAETVEVVAGLDAPLPVVVRGNESLRSGQPVRVIGAD